MNPTLPHPAPAQAHGHPGTNFAGGAFAHRGSHPASARAIPRDCPAPTIAHASHAATTLVIGCGNTLRGDDAAGPIVAEAVGMLGQHGVESIVCQQLTPELSARIAGAARVIFVDATVEPASLQSSLPMAREIKAGTSGGPILGHSGDPTMLMALAQGLFGRVPRAWLVTIPARHFEIGAGLSPTCAAAVAPAVALVRRLCAP